MQAEILIQREPPGGREAVRAANAELTRCFGPPRTKVSWLYADWIADEYGDPCERFVVYQMIPRHLIKLDVLVGLEGPPPETMGFFKNVRQSYQTVKPGCHPISERRWVSTAPPGVTQRKWELYRQFGCEARIFWVIQGSNGGHKYKIKSPHEKKLRKLMGLPADTPYIGQLPFAPFDDRVIDQLISIDEERKQVKFATELLNRSKDAIDRAEAEELYRLREQLKKWWSDQVDEAVDLGGMTGRGGWWARERSNAPLIKENAPNKEVIEEEFLTDRPVVAGPERRIYGVS